MAAVVRCRSARPRTAGPSYRKSIICRISLQPSSGAAAAAAAVAALALWAPIDAARAEEEVQLPAAAAAVAEAMRGMNDGQKQKLQAADDSFKQSDTLRALLERSEANKAKNKREIENKYCYRQAELGVGDCGGLRLIPGMTKNGKQKTPEWLQKALGVEVPEVEGQGKTLRDLLGPEPGQ